MSLIKKATLVVNDENNLLTLTDVTGEDNLANSTKYSTGSTNLNRNKNNTISEFIITKEDGSIVTIKTNDLFSSVSPSLAAKSVLVPKNGLSNTFTPQDLGYDTTVTKFPVGVIKIEYWTWYYLQLGQVITNLKTITAVDSTFTSLRLGFVDTMQIKLIKQSSSGIEANRQVSVVVDDENLTLEQDLPSTFAVNDSVAIFAGYLTTVYVLTDGLFLDCFQPKIANISISESSCCKTCKSDNVNNLTEMLLGYFGVEAQMEAAKYEMANSNIKTLYKICQAVPCKTC
jgi:hypothetical protein